MEPKYAGLFKQDPSASRVVVVVVLVVVVIVVVVCIVFFFYYRRCFPFFNTGPIKYI
jgi:hypothetical protein